VKWITYKEGFKVQGSPVKFASLHIFDIFNWASKVSKKQSKKNDGTLFPKLNNSITVQGSINVGGWRSTSL
jgi:hypothetical protein